MASSRASRALASYLAEKVPRSAAPAKLPAAPATLQSKPSQPGSGSEPATGRPGRPAATTADDQFGVQAIFRDQLQAMSQLINRQFEMLQSLGLADSPVPGVSPATTAPVASASTDAPVTATASDSDSAKSQQGPSRFQVYKPVQKSADSGLAPEQRRHIETLVKRYTTKTAGSKLLTQTHRGVLADPRAAAGFRAEWKEMVYPIVCARCSGSKLWDVDGNEYIDLVNGYGQTAVRTCRGFCGAGSKGQLEKGFAIGPQAELAGKVAALFTELTGNERMTFCNTGSEAVMAAMRVARTVTGREKIVIFNGDYHGQFDEVLVRVCSARAARRARYPVAPGIPGAAAENMIVLDYATAATLQWIRDNAGDLAAVIVEPVQSRHPNLQPWDFLREVRKITEESGTAFVLDEVVTGFRVHTGGIQAVTGIRADLVTYGKVLGGGLPVGILAGKARFMDALDGGQWDYGDDSIPEVGVTFFAGTFVRHPLVLAATWAVLNHLKQQGPTLQEQLANRAKKLALEINELFAQHGLSTHVEHFSSWFYFSFHNEHPLAPLFFYHLRERGIHIQDGFPCFLTTAHSDADITFIFDAFKSSWKSCRRRASFAPRKTKSWPSRNRHSY